MNSSLNVSGGPSDQGDPQKSMAKVGIVLALGLVINYINGTLIHTFRKHQVFYLNPRYILFTHLVINDMLQLTTSISLVVLGNVFYRIDVLLCCLILSLAIFTTVNTPLNLAVMAAECYVAVCFPLRHARLVTVRRTCVLIGCMWALNAASTLADVFLILATEPERLAPGGSLYCEKNNLFRHPASLKKREVSYNLCLACVWLTVAYAYVRIFSAARAARTSGGAAEKAKARNTVLLHGFQLLLCMLTYVAPVVIRALIAAFPRFISQIVFTIYVLVHIVPRLLSPVVYGLRDKTFRRHLRTHLLCAGTQGVGTQGAGTLGAGTKGTGTQGGGTQGAGTQGGGTQGGGTQGGGMKGVGTYGVGTQGGGTQGGGMKGVGT